MIPTQEQLTEFFASKAADLCLAGKDLDDAVGNYISYLVKTYDLPEADPEFSKLGEALKKAADKWKASAGY